MEAFEGIVTYEGTNYKVHISPIYYEVLKEINYHVSCMDTPPILLAWENDDNPGFKIQGAAPYFMHQLKEAISVYIENHYA